MVANCPWSRKASRTSEREGNEYNRPGEIGTAMANSLQRRPQQPPETPTMSANRKLGVAIQGAGNVSTEHIRAYQRNPHTEVVAIGSRREEGARAKAVQMGLDCAIYT